MSFCMASLIGLRNISQSINWLAFVSGSLGLRVFLVVFLFQISVVDPYNFPTLPLLRITPC